MYSSDAQPSSSIPHESSSFKCTICYKDFNSGKTNKPDYGTSKRIFGNCTRLLNVQLILPMQWNFKYEDLPFCTLCTGTVIKLLELNEKLHVIQNEIRVTLQNVKIEILKTQDANSKRMVEPIGRRRGTRGSASYLEKVDYFRSFAVKDFDPDVKLNKNNVLHSKPVVQSTQCPKSNASDYQRGFEFKTVKPYSIPSESQEEANDDDDDGPSANTPDDGSSEGVANSDATVNENDIASGLIKLTTHVNLPPEKEYLHNFTRQGGSRYQCNLCKKILMAPRPGNLKRHIVMTHERLKRYKCKYCPNTYFNSNDGIRHIRSRHLNKSTNETQISQVVQSIPKPKPSNSVIPMEEILKRVVELNTDDKRPTSEKYKRHYKKVGENYVCKICTRQVKSIKDIVRHVHASHKGKANFQCFYCGKKFFERYICVKHLKSAHETVLREEAQIVNENDNEEASLENDESISSDKAAPMTSYIKIGNTFKCKKCNFSSIYKTSVFRHNRQVHTNSFVKPGIIKFSFSKKTAAKPEIVSSQEQGSTPEKIPKVTDLKPDSNADVIDGVIFVGPPPHITQLIEDSLKKGTSKKRFKCKSCNYATPVFTNAKRHVRDIHLQFRAYKCSYCKSEHLSRKQCRMHILLNHSEDSKSANQSSSNLDSKTVTPVKVSTLKANAMKRQPNSGRLDESHNMETESSGTTEGETNTRQTLRSRRSDVQYSMDADIIQEDDEERLCIKLPASDVPFPFSVDILSKYVPENNPNFCRICEKQFTQIQQHIANVHEGLRNYQCFICSSTFFYRSKCIRHIKEKCLKEKDNLVGVIKTENKSIPTSSSQVKTAIKSKSSKSTSSKKLSTKTFTQPSKHGVYAQYYERTGKSTILCKICNKRADSKSIVNHFVKYHKDICLYKCDYCDEKFYRRQALTSHVVRSHPEVQSAEPFHNGSPNKPNTTESSDTRNDNHISEDVEISETTVKRESTWVEFSLPLDEESRDQFLESNEPENLPSVSTSYTAQEEERIPQETAVLVNDTSHPYGTEKSTEKEAPKSDYGCISILQQSHLNCDPFIDKDSANKCKVCNKPFKLRKLVIDHIKNVHLGVRRYQCEFCNKKYYHLAACKQHVEDNHPPENVDQNNQECNKDLQPNSGTAETTVEEVSDRRSSYASAEFQISNVCSQATIAPSEEITLDNSMLAVEEPVSFEPWKELPSSQDKQIEPFFAMVSDDSDEEEDEEEPQFVVQEQNGFGFSNEESARITEDVSIYDIVGTENILELPIEKINSESFDYTEKGNGVLSCNTCQKEFAVRKSMINHINVKHKQVARFMCKMCEKKYYHKYHVAQHIASIHMKRDVFKCRVCAKTYGHASGLKKHYGTAHGNVNFNSREQWCQICKLPFQSPQDLIIHMSRIHSR